MDGKGKPLDHLDLGERARDLAVSPDGFAWVLGKTRLYKVSEDGKVAAKYDLKRQGIAEPRYLALDPAGGFAWVSGDKQIVRVKTNGDQRLTHVRVPKRAAIAGLAANPADGTIYAAGRRSLLVFGRDGRLHRKVELGRYRLGSIGGFAFDAPSSGLWLAGGSKILHFSPTGEVVAELNSSGGVAALGTVAYAAPTRGIEPPEGPSPEAPPEEAQPEEPATNGDPGAQAPQETAAPEAPNPPEPPAPNEPTAGQQEDDFLGPEEKEEWVNRRGEARPREGAISALAVDPSAYPMNLHNEHLSLLVGSDGRFNMGAKPNPTTGGAQEGSYNLSYRWSRSPGTSRSTVRIDGADYVYGSSGTAVEAPNNANGANVSEWELPGGVRVRQTLRVVEGFGTGKADAAEVTYELRNTSTSAHTVGLKAMIDTMINDDDGALFYVPGAGKVTKETEFVGQEVPEHFAVMRSVDNMEQVASGTLRGRDATTPDRLVLGQWSLGGDAFDYTLSPGQDLTRDSAYAAYWLNKPLPAGDSLTFTHYYGVNGRPVPEEEPDPVTADDHGEPFDPNAVGGDPINFVTGNMYEAREDLNVPGRGLPLNFARFYNSQDTLRGPLGYGWTHTYNASMKENPDGSVTELDPQGKRLVFSRSADGSYAAPKGNRDVLKKAADGSYELAKKDGHKWHFRPDGKLDRISDPDGNAITMSYDASGRLGRITDTTGRETVLGHNASGLIETLTDPAGNVTRYGYDVGRLTSVTDPEGATIFYGYDVLANITEIRDRRGVSNYFSYDDHDRVVYTSGPGGRERMYVAYDDVNGKTTVTDAMDGVYVFHYNDMSRITKLVRPDGKEIDYAWDAEGNRTSRTDGRSNTSSATYDDKGNPTEIKAPAGGGTTTAVTRRTYDALGNITSQTDALGKVSRYAYDARGNLVEAVDALGGKTTYEYDERGQLVKETGPDGTANPDGAPGTASTTYAYDASGNMTDETDALGNKTEYTYDTLGHATSKTDALGNKTEYAYDRLGQLVEVTNPDGTTRRFGYDANGNTTSETDENGNVSRTYYDLQNLPVEIQDPLGNITSLRYESEGNLISERDPNSNETYYEYDALGQMTKTKVPDGTRNPDGSYRLATTSYAYDASGNRTKETDPMGRVTTFEYDALGRLTKKNEPDGTTNPDGTPGVATTSYEHDLLGRLVYEIDPAGNKTTYEHDALGRVIKETRPDGTENPDGTPGTTSTSYEYDAAGNQTKSTDASGRATLMRHDALGRLVEVTDPAGGKAAFAFDALGRTTKTTNPNGHATTYGYDARGRLAEEIDPSGNVTAFSYDDANNLTGRTDAERRTTTYAYDAANRPVSTSYPDGTEIASTYDANGNLTSAANENGTLSFAYDPRNLLTRETLPDVRSTSYEYDDAGDRTALVDPAGGRTAYAHDGAGRLASVTDPDGAKTTYSYDSLNRPARISFPGGATETYAYDPLDRVTSITGNAANGDVLAKLSYGYDKAGNPVSVSDGDKKSTFAYDDLDRLLKETHPEKSVSYAYDAAGNRTSMTEGEGVGTETTYDYDAAERMTRAGEASFAYDRTGNQTAMTVGRNTTRYAYDAEGRITKAGNVGFERDALGRVASTERLVPPGPVATELAPAEPRSFAYDGDQVIQEKDEKGNTARYTRGLGGNLLSRKTGADVPSYYLHDAIGSVAGLTDGASKLTDSYRYSAFGGVLARTGTTPNPFGYVENRAEPAAGLSDFNARAYDPAVGRFTSKSPTKALPTMTPTTTPYAYAFNGPLAYTDRDGLAAQRVITRLTPKGSPKESLPDTTRPNPGRSTDPGPSPANPLVPNQPCYASLDLPCDPSIDVPPAPEPNPVPEPPPAPGEDVAIGPDGPCEATLACMNKRYGGWGAYPGPTDGDGIDGPGNVNGILNNARQVRGPFPRTANPGETLVRRDPNTNAPTHYQTYDWDGLPVKRVDLTGRPHGGIPTPHVVEFVRNVNPRTGEVFVRPNRLVRPARPEEIP